jgi:hypothetical protein
MPYAVEYRLKATNSAKVPIFFDEFSRTFATASKVKDKATTINESIAPKFVPVTFLLRIGINAE